MKVPFGLRAKILWGALILLVPLAVSLVFLYGYANNRIRASLVEKEGLGVTAPLLNILLGWQATGVDREPGDDLAKAFDAFTLQAQGAAASLNYNAEDQKTDGIDWLGPDGLKALVKPGARGEYEKFASVHERLSTELGFLADNSGLVLDPGLDSYYLMLALYQSVPGLLDGLTSLREFTRPATRPI